MRSKKLDIFKWFSKIPGILYTLICLIIIFSIFSSQFATLSNLFNIMRQSSVLIIMSIGMLIAIISGGIDLSIGSLLGLTGAITAYLLHGGISLPISIISAILACSILGLISGVVITKGGIFPFIATFGMLFIAKGIGQGIAWEGTEKSVYITNESFKHFGRGVFFDVPSSFWITVFIIGIAAFLIKWTVFGASISAIGTNEIGARAIGVKADLQKILVYVFSATFAGVAGIVLVSRTLTGNAIIGIGMEFEAIAAVVIGGTPITGGRGSLTGTVLGAIVISVLKNGLTMLGLPPEVVSVIIGGVIMISVIIAQFLYIYRSRRSAGI